MMRPPLRDVRTLARALLQQEGAGAQVTAEAAERVLRRLAEGISPLVGAGGFYLLLQRAQKRARGAHRWLHVVQLDPDAPWRLAGVAEATRDAPEDVSAAAEAGAAAPARAQLCVAAGGRRRRGVSHGGAILDAARIWDSDTWNPGGM